MSEKVGDRSTYIVKPGDSLWTIANKYNVTVEQLKQTNNLDTNRLMPGDRLIIPTAVKSPYLNYTVQAGDSLWQLANKYNTSVDMLKQINSLDSSELIKGQMIYVPSSKMSSNSTYTVQQGDSLYRIAQKFNTSVRQLKALNNIDSTTIKPGDILRVVSEDSDATTLNYTVEEGDSLWGIANFYGMTVDELKTLNQITSNELQVGQTLTVIKRQVPPEITTITYTVKEGDSLWEIANHFGTTVKQIKLLNSLSSDALDPGQKLTLSKSIKPTDSNILVRVKRYNGRIERVPLEEYVTGVVSSELSAGFNDEAYKALALAARTYAIKRIRQGETISDTASHQVYKDKEQLRKWWGDEFEEIYTTIRSAVNETNGEVITYDHEFIDALFFSTSNGRTENPKNVWGGTLPYLKSVDSRWDTKSPHYYDAKVLTYSQFRSRLGLSSNTNLYANIISRTDGGSIDQINISGKTFTGEQVRKRLALKSTDFDIKFINGQAKIRQRGWGHQVGLSQYGAHYMGEEGYNYREIINHYYPGVEITNLR